MAGQGQQLLKPVMAIRRMTVPYDVVQSGGANGECAPSTYHQLSRYKRIVVSRSTPSANTEYSLISDSE